MTHVFLAAGTTTSNGVVLAGDWITWASDKISAVQTLLIAATAVVAIWAVIKVYSRTQAIAPTLIAFLVGGLVVWGVANMNLLAAKTGTEITNTTQPGTAPTSLAAPHHLGDAPESVFARTGRERAEMTNTPADQQLVGRSYTRARRFPLVIGQLPGGGRLIGGPYTLTQIGVMAGTLLLLYLSAPVWAHLGVLNVVVLLGLPYGASWLVRHARVEGREPLRAAVGYAAFLAAPATGRLRGDVLRPARPARAAAPRFLVTAAPAPAPAGDRAPAPARAAVPARSEAAVPRPLARLPRRPAPTATSVAPAAPLRAAPPSAALSSVARLKAAAAATTPPGSS